MKTSTIRIYYRLAGYTYLGAFGFAGMATFMYLHTHWQAYRVRTITAAAARGILEPVGILRKELKKSGMDVQLPDFEIETENRGVRRKSTFRLVDGKVELVKEIEEQKEENAS
jgi:hypothetical protein